MSLADQYEVLELIGRGSFGQIRKVRRKQDGHILVRKEIAYHRMSEKERHQLTAECGILSQVKHPNIVEYYTRDHVKSDSTLHLYMEYCGQGDLSMTIRECRSAGRLLPESMIWTYFTQIVLALYRCHNGVNPPAAGQVWDRLTRPHLSKDKKTVKILHRDLKPENIFLGQDGDVKLGDFGLSKMLAPEQHLANTYVGTPYYMSPEIVSDLSYTHKSDMWSLGCIVYELCQLSPPFNAKTQWSLIDKIKSGQYQSISNSYSAELRNVIDMCLRVDPARRPDTAELLEMDVFKLMRKERELVLLHRQLALREKRVQAREEEAVRKEEQIFLQAEEMREEYEARSMQLHAEISASLQAKWEVLAQKEIRRQVDMQVAASLDVELARRIQELDLVPRGQRDIPPTTNTSLESSRALSGPHFVYQDVMVPGSPMDIIMASPSVQHTPGRRPRLMSEEPPKLAPMAQPDTNGRAMGPPPSPTRGQQHRAMLADMTNFGPLTDSRLPENGLRRNATSAFPNGSPVRLVPLRRNGLQRAGTTGLLHQDHKDWFGLGDGGSGADDGKSSSAVVAKSIIEINREKRASDPPRCDLGLRERGKRSSSSDQAPQWDPQSPDAPSPFKKDL